MGTQGTIQRLPLRILKTRLCEYKYRVVSEGYRYYAEVRRKGKTVYVTTSLAQLVVELGPLGLTIGPKGTIVRNPLLKGEKR